jgi:hypothetical protein
MQARSRELTRLDAFLNRTRQHKLHLLTSVLWLSGRKLAGVRRVAASPLPLASSGERTLELRHRPQGHP